MTTERIPKKVQSGRLPCGHPIGWLLRLRDGHELFKYCWGCMVEKIKLDEAFPKQETIAEKTVRKETKANERTSESMIAEKKSE